MWLLVAASAVHWGLRLWVQGRAVPLQSQTVGVAQALQGDASRLFVRQAAAPVAPVANPGRDRFRVLGAAASGEAGFVVMSVDGKPARTYRVGAAVDAQWAVLSVQQRRIEIGPAGGPVAVSLDLPGMPTATTGRLPSVAEAGLITVPRVGMDAAAGAPTVAPGAAPNPVAEPIPDSPAAR